MNSSKNRSVAFLLGFFLGGFGVHRFYVGKGGSGIAMLIMSCTLILLPVSGVWALVDVIRIGVGSFTDKEGLLINKW